MPTIQLEGMRPIPNLLPKIAAPSPITGLGDGIKTCANLTTILCLRALYNFGAGNTSAAGNEMGIGEWADFLYLPDLPLFFKNFTSPQIPADTVPDFISIDGGQTANYTYDKENESGVESALDFDTAYSIIYPQKLRLYQVGDGVNVDSVVSTLLDKRFIAETGRREVVGRPMEYRTTPEFLESFGLRSLSELPPVDLDAETLEIPLPIATQPVAEAEEEAVVSHTST